MLESTVKYTEKLNTIEERINRNEKITKSIVAHALQFYQIDEKELGQHVKEAATKRLADKTSVVQAMKHFVRDWSEEGAKERNEAFPCILGILLTLYPQQLEVDEPTKVLLPGSGLGRLAHAVADLDKGISERRASRLNANESRIRGHYQRVVDVYEHCLSLSNGPRQFGPNFLSLRRCIIPPCYK
jgi:hypothetical protein